MRNRLINRSEETSPFMQNRQEVNDLIVFIT